MHVEVAGRRALRPGLALAGEADARAVLDAGGDRHLQRALALHRAGAVADPAGVAITRPVPPQVGQVRSTRKKPCCARTLPAPPQVGQVVVARAACSPSRCRRRPRRRRGSARAAAPWCRRRPRRGRSRPGRAGRRRARWRAAAAAAAHELAEHLVEDVAEPALAAEVEAEPRRARRRPARTRRGRSGHRRARFWSSFRTS